VETGDAVSLLVIVACAVLAPLLCEVVRFVRVPSVLFELLLGVIVGPAVLGWAQLDPFVEGLSALGLSVLFFVAGYELDLQRLRGRPLRLAGASWGITLLLAAAAGVTLASTGYVRSSLLVGLALTTTALGTLLPMLSDRGVLGTEFGRHVSAAGAIGEFGPVVAVTLLLGSSQPAAEAALLFVFVVITVVVAALAARPQPPRLLAILQRHLTTTSQLPVRVLMLLIVAMVAVASVLGLDTLLGAFAAGLIARRALRPEQVRTLQPRIEAVSFGFLIPVFFVVSGMKFDVTALFEDPGNLLRMGLFLVLLLVVRGLPALLVYRGLLPLAHRGALGLLQATALPLIVVITEIGVSTGQMQTVTAVALVGAGMCSVLLFPLVGFAFLDRAGPLDE
jgi:Kef-type K+ transport system membrane component KefB